MVYSSLNEPRKRCPDCGIEKSVNDFGKNAKLPDGLQFYCRACCARRGAEVYRRKRERLGKKVRPKVDVPPGHKRCPACERVLPHSEWHRNRATRSGFADRCKDCRAARSREQHLQKHFGISVVQRQAMLDEQGGVCAICKVDPPTHTDHNHATQELRGLLCTGCNLGLGQFRDDPQRLVAAARYLMGHGSPKKGTAAVIDIGYWTGPSPLESNLRHHLAS